MQNRLFLFISLLFASFIWSVSTGQQTAEIDSLKKIVNTLPDEEKASVYNLILRKTPRGQYNDSTIFYAQQAIYFAEKFQDTTNLIYGCRNLAISYHSLEQWPKARQYYLRTLDLVIELNDGRRAALVYRDISETLISERKYNQAAEYLFEALEYCEENECKDGIIDLYIALGRLYRHLNQLDKAEQYLKNALELEENTTDSYQFNLVYIYKLLGLTKYGQKEYGQAIYFLKKGLENPAIQSVPHELMIFNNSLGLVYKDLNDMENVLKHYNLALEQARKSNSQNLIAAAYINLGQVYINTGEYNKALELIDKGLVISKENGFIKWQKNAYHNLYFAYEKMNDIPKAYENYKNYVALTDSLRLVESNERIAELETKYETEKKEKQIELLNKENVINTLKLKQNRNLVLLLFILLVVILISAFNYNRQIRQRQKSRAIIEKQEVEKKLLSTVISTEDKERKRFAADLHDGLGPLLSSVKLYLSGIEDAQADQKQQMISTATELIDQSIRTTRTISNNILPVELTEKGLVGSIRTFCDKIQLSQQMSISISDQTAGHKLEPSTEIILYRVIQELINNTIKHADAQAISIKFSAKPKLYSVEYTDNGIGFDKAEVMQRASGGIGLLNIQERIDSLGGNIDFSKNEPKGTHVMIKLAI